MNTDGKTPDRAKNKAWLESPELEFSSPPQMPRTPQVTQRFFIRVHRCSSVVPLFTAFQWKGSAGLRVIRTNFLASLFRITPRGKSALAVGAGNPRVFSKGSITAVQIAGRHPRFVGAQQIVVNDLLTFFDGGLTIGKGAEPVSFTLIHIMEIIINENLIGVRHVASIESLWLERKEIAGSGFRFRAFFEVFDED
jgi:hypothetical protein